MKKASFVLWIATLAVLAVRVWHYKGVREHYAPLMDTQSIDHYNHADSMTMLYLAVFAGVAIVGLVVILLAALRWSYPMSTPPRRQSHWDAPVVAEPMSTFRIIESGQSDEPQEAPRHYGFYDWAAPGVDPIAS